MRWANIWHNADLPSPQPLVIKGFTLFTNLSADIKNELYTTWRLIGGLKKVNAQQKTLKGCGI